MDAVLQTYPQFIKTRSVAAPMKAGSSSSVEAFTYNADGTIPLIAMTKEGVSPAGTLNPYKRTEAETGAWAEKYKVTQTDNGQLFVSDIRTNGYVKVRSVDFGTTSPKTFSASLAAGLDGGILEVYVDSLKGTKLATINVPHTGGWQSWKPFSATVASQVTGVHDVYFSFKGQNITAGRLLYNFDYWEFKK